MEDGIKIETQVPQAVECIQKEAFQNEITFNSLTESVSPAVYTHTFTHTHTYKLKHVLTCIKSAII